MSSVSSRNRQGPMVPPTPLDLAYLRAQAGDHDRCLVTLVFHIDAGQVEGVDVSGRTAVVVGDAPGMMADGNWKLGLVIDDAASDQQADAIGRVFGGQLGGPMGALAPLVGEMLGVERAAIEYVDDGRQHSVSVGDIVDIAVEDIRHGEDGPPV